MLSNAFCITVTLAQCLQQNIHSLDICYDEMDSELGFPVVGMRVRPVFFFFFSGEFSKILG